jgi:hypothetical protein
MKIKQGDAKATLAAHREQDLARHAKRMAEVWAMPTDEVPIEGAQWSVPCDTVMD